MPIFDWEGLINQPGVGIEFTGVAFPSSAGIFFEHEAPKKSRMRHVSKNFLVLFIVS